MFLGPRGLRTVLIPRSDLKNLGARIVPTTRFRSGSIRPNESATARSPGIPLIIIIPIESIADIVAIRILDLALKRED